MNNYTETQKAAVIDRENMTFVAIADSFDKALLIADIASMDTTTYTCLLSHRSGFSVFSAQQLKLLLKNTTNLPQLPDSVVKYGTLVKEVHDVALTLPVDKRSENQLRKEIERLPPPIESVEKAKTQPIIHRMTTERGYPTASSVVEPKIPRVQSGITSPPSKGSTGKVWIIADRVHTENGNGSITKELRRQIIAACVAEGINAGTASTQYGKWKGTKNLN